LSSKVAHGQEDPSATNATQTDRAIAILHALTGSIDVPGGNVHFAQVPVNDVSGIELRDPAQWQKALGLKERPLGPAADGWITSTDLYRAVLDRQSYQVRGLVGFGANLLLSHADAKRGAEALSSLEFHVQRPLFDTNRRLRRHRAADCERVGERRAARRFRPRSEGLVHKGGRTLNTGLRYPLLRPRCDDHQ
jgi:hypothetical protein